MLFRFWQVGINWWHFGSGDSLSIICIVLMLKNAFCKRILKFPWQDIVHCLPCVQNNPTRTLQFGDWCGDGCVLDATAATYDLENNNNELVKGEWIILYSVWQCSVSPYRLIRSKTIWPIKQQSGSQQSQFGQQLTKLKQLTKLIWLAFWLTL